MKKKALVTLLASCIVFTMCACGGGESAAAPTMEATDLEPIVEKPATESDFYEEEENTILSDAEDIMPEEVVLASYPLTELYPFSEGRAWVNFEDNGIICTGVIDTNGRLLYRTDKVLWYVSQFADGLTFYRENDTENSPSGIIDSEGNVLFESHIETDGGYLVLAYGNEHFFVAQHIQNFDTDEYRYGTIDKNGNILNDMVRQDYMYEERWLESDEYNSYIKYIGENFIQLPMGLYNISTERFSLFPLIGSLSYCPEASAGDFDEGYTILVAQYFNSKPATVIGTDYYREGHEEPSGIYSESHYDIPEATEYSEGLIWSNEEWIGIPGYYDKDWNLVISLEQYKDNKVTGGAFRGGYGAVTMTGADGKLYASIIDREGSLIYSPIEIDSADPNNAGNGYFQVTINGAEKIIGPDGTTYTPGRDDLSVLKDATFGSISEGFMILGNTYINLDGGEVVSSAILKETSAVAGSTAGVNTSNENNPNEESISYIMPSSYSIEGKWKSVGESGFGQAQSDAVIVFSDANCNFFSPNDTYAFYNDGSRYILDVTSLLGDSLSFTVNIIDDDNIDITNGSTVTSLTRVDL